MVARKRATEQQYNHPLLLVLKSGKWSMADVLVIAIFMAYIGFNGLVGSQMEGLSRSSEAVEIFTTNGTKLWKAFTSSLAL